MRNDVGAIGGLGDLKASSTFVAYRLCDAKMNDGNGDCEIE